MFGENVSEEASSKAQCMRFGADRVYFRPQVSMDLIKTPGFNPILNQITLWMLVISPLTKFALATQPVGFAGILCERIWLTLMVFKMNVTLENLLGLTAPALTVEVCSTPQYKASETDFFTFRSNSLVKHTSPVELVEHTL